MWVFLHFPAYFFTFAVYILYFILIFVKMLAYKLSIFFLYIWSWNYTKLHANYLFFYNQVEDAQDFFQHWNQFIGPLCMWSRQVIYQLSLESISWVVPYLAPSHIWKLIVGIGQQFYQGVLLTFRFVDKISGFDFLWRCKEIRKHRILHLMKWN